MRAMTAVLACAVLALAACGGDDDDAGGAQGEVADRLLDEAADQDLALDESCVRDKASQLSDEDAQKLLDAEDDEDPDLSPEGEQVTAELFSCVSVDAFIDQVVSSLPEGVDAECVREKLQGIDLGAFAEGGQAPPEFSAAMVECVSG